MKPDLQSSGGVEGDIQIALGLAAETISDVIISSTRPIGAIQIFQGKTIDQALSLMPMMFSLCGRAQTIAGAVAAEQALGVRASATINQARDILILSEALEQDALRFSLDWAALIGRAPDISGLQQLKAAVHTLTKPLMGACQMSGGAAGPKIDWTALDTQAKALANLANEVFQKPDDLGSLAALKAWAQATDGLMPELIDWAMADDRAGLGGTDMVVLGTPDLADIDHHLSGADAGNFEAKPSWRGQWCETGPLDRYRDHPLIRDCREIHGLGLLARLIARCLHLWEIPEKIRTIISLSRNSAEKDKQGENGRLDVTGGEAGYNQSEAMGMSPQGSTEEKHPDRQSAGIAAVFTARGWLVHRLILAPQDRVIRDYRAVAPTEWNFAAEGPLHQGLMTLPATDWADAETKAAALITALDPCVQYRITKND